MLVGGHEIERLAQPDRRQIRAQRRRHKTLEQQRRRGGVAVVALVAHLQRLPDQRFHLHRAKLFERCGQHRTQSAGDPLQAVDHFAVVGAEP